MRMNVRLVVEHGARRRVMNIESDEAVLGRGRGNTVRIPSAEVSRRHCRLLLRDGLVTVEDLDSVNGTFINGRRLREAEYLRPGDRLEVGPVTFVVEYELTPDALARLRGEDDAGLLELLANGEAAELEELPVVAESLPLDALPEVEDAMPLADLPEVEQLPEDDVDLAAELLPATDDAPLPMDFDFDAAPWQMPEGGDLRDILSQMEDDDSPTQFPKGK
jgi:hypothetical protein